MATRSFDYVLVGTGQATSTLIGGLLAKHSGDRPPAIGIIEGGHVGGTCVNDGCTPTKTLVASARAAHVARRASAYGVETGEVRIDFGRVMERMNEVRHGSRNGLADWLTGQDEITLIREWAEFVGPRRLKAGDDIIEGHCVFLNVGGRARIPAIPGLDSIHWLDNTRLLELTEVPDHLIIVGGSYIGLEFGQMFRRFGAEVTILERGERIIKQEDADISAGVHEILENEGIRFMVDTEVSSVAPGPHGEGVVVTVDTPSGTETVAGSHFLIGAGRIPNTDRLNPEAGGIETDKRGYVKVNEVLCTTAERVYALGDVNGQGAFTHTSVNDAEIVLGDLFDGNIPGGRRTVEDRLLTYALFTDPPLGRVGLTERQAIEHGMNVLKATRPMAQVSRAKEMGETQGFIKLLVNADTDQIVGAATLGANGDEIINMLTAFMHGGQPCRTYRSVVLVHPTISEIIPWVLDDLEPVESTPAPPVP